MGAEVLIIVFLPISVIIWTSFIITVMWGPSFAFLSALGAGSIGLTILLLVALLPGEVREAAKDIDADFKEIEAGGLYLMLTAVLILIGAVLTGATA